METNIRVLVVDDEAMSARIMARQLRDQGYLAEAETSAIAAVERIPREGFDVVVSDLRMPQMDGLTFLRKVRDQNPDTFVIMMTAFGTVDTAVEAMMAGASDFLTKPFPPEVLTVRLEKLVELCEARREIHALKALLSDNVDNGHGGIGLVGRSAGMKLVGERILTFANSSVPVLVVGETGTGKELVARSIHRHSPRRHGPFIGVACGAIPAELAESELFGHVHGAFTGATQSRRGVFERARGGTLLLDDVDDLPPDIQVKLLRVLEEGTLTRVGGSEEIKVDVRLVATTKVDLSGKGGGNGGFRDDLYFRLCGLEISLPPLRERGDDILLLATHFLGKIAGDDGLPSLRLSAEAARMMCRYRWPGNVRELRRSMESAAVLSGGQEVCLEHLSDHFQSAAREQGDPQFSLHLDGVSRIPFRNLVSKFEADLLRWALGTSGGNQFKAAEVLDLPRSTFQNKLRKLSPS